MYGKFRFSMNGFIYFLMWSMFNFKVTCDTCPDTFNGGYISPFCSRRPGDYCPFYCNRTFITKGFLLTCGNNGSWIPDTNSSCIKSDPCPDVFNGGYVVPSCRRDHGDSCTFNCNPGFVKKGYLLTCGDYGNWFPDTNSSCIPLDACPDEFSGGYISPLCSRRLRVFCNSNYYPEFVKIGFLLTCGNNGSWIPDTNSNCIKLYPCPDVFNGGYVVPSCRRVQEDSCTFNCNPGFVKKGNLLTCGDYGNWFPDTDLSCIPLDACPDEFNGGYISPFCSRRHGVLCTFYCNQKFVKIGYLLTCGNNGSWIEDTNSICIKSVEQTSSNSGLATKEDIIAITTPFLLVTIIITIFCIWLCKRLCVRNSQRVPGHAGATCLRPRENRDQNITTLRQQPNADVINSVSSFESPSYNGINVRSFEQWTSTISNSCRYYEPPPSYTEIQIATDETLPTYKEAVRDNTNFNLYI